MRPLFFFGSLRDRELLEIVLGRAVAASDLTPARVVGYLPCKLADEAYPHLAPKPGADAEGVLFDGYDAHDLERLEYYEEAEYGLSPITVETEAGPVEAQFFEATGKLRPEDTFWDFARWQREEKPLALEAADELLAHFGIVPVEESDAIWQGIKIRARMRLRAKSEAPVPARLRSGHAPEDVQSLAIGRPYTRYFAIEEHRLRHRRFDGGWSPEIVRSALTSGDAVTVLPYDPRQNTVMLIEQFRAPMLARGDACPWGIEVIAGRIDREAEAEACARREAVEEAGLELGRIELISRYYSSPGIAAEHITSFVGEADLSDRGGVFGAPDEDEDIRAFTVALDEALAAVATGEINNAPALLSLLWLQTNADRLRSAWGA